MKNLAPVLLFAVLMACDPCPDCGEPILKEPTVEMIFINQDSINLIDDSLAVFDFNDSSLTANIDSLEVLTDSLQIVLDSIASGGMLDTEKSNLESLIASRKGDSAFFAFRNKDADSLSSILQGTRSTINTGLMVVSELTILETGASITYSETDSMESWNFPLLFEATATSYEFVIAEERYGISLGYETFTEVDQQRNFLILS